MIWSKVWEMFSGRPSQPHFLLGMSRSSLFSVSDSDLEDMLVGASNTWEEKSLSDPQNY